ncbi:MAG: hypothetical protein ACLR0P_02995 [Oscillospiraceae bacterium]
MTTNRLREVDLERGMPTMRAALQQLSFELRRGRSLGCAAVKLIHGYGSSGKGGRIRVEARACLARMKERGELRDVIPGEEFTIFEPRTLAAFQRCPDLREGPGSGAAQQWDHRGGVIKEGQAESTLTADQKSAREKLHRPPAGRFSSNLPFPGAYTSKIRYFLSDFSIKRSQSLLGRDETSTPSVPGIRRQRACLVSLGEEVKQTAPQIVQVLETSVRGQKEQGAVPVQAGADTR